MNMVTAITPSLIRNFCIIAHIDHGKSTLADRFLEITGTVRPQEMKQQFMDQMDLERERGITIKGKAVTMYHQAPDGQTYQLNLIDTPGHVDFSYEVSRALASCQGAILVVDASQGIEAQTIAHTLLALQYGLELIPVVNKVDLPQAEPQRVAGEMKQVFGFREEEVLFVSAKEGTGAREILDAVVARVPAPKGDPEAPTRALVFDSVYNSYKGIIAYVYVTDGHISKNDKIQVMSSGKTAEIVEVGVFAPAPKPTDCLTTGQVGYVATGFKDVRECSVGDTLTNSIHPAQQPLPGYLPLKSMVFAGLYPSEGENYNNLRTALEKLQLNDASLTMEPESSNALGFGFRCGFLGLMHLDIVQERLEREYDLDLVVTAPSVAYQVVLQDGQTVRVDNPSKLPSPSDIAEIQEPILGLTIVAPSRHIGTIMELMHARRAEFKRMEYIQGLAPTGQGLAPTGQGLAPKGQGQVLPLKDEVSQAPGNGPLPSGQPGEAPQAPEGQSRVVMEYTMPLGEMLADFYNQLKSRTQGYASLDYTFDGYRAAPLVKVDILVNHFPVEALSMILHKDRAVNMGKLLVEKLRGSIPRQMFEVPIQAAIGSRVIARETVRALRKDVLAKCYGGDISRKRKLLEKQKEGKKRMKKVGQVEVPQEAFLSLLKISGEG
jgi:GTP-binding protein LepA